MLDRLGGEIFILALHGFIFFGTANTLFEGVRRRLSQADLPPVKFVVLDFAQVTGLDSTGLLSFTKMLQLAQQRGITLLLTGLREEVRERFVLGGFAGHANARLFPDLDRGVEWCENQLLPEQSDNDARQTLAGLLAALGSTQEGVNRLVAVMRRSEVPAGERLIAQGDTADEVFFIESGQVSAYLESPDHQPLRLETMRGGRVVGELAFYLGTPRTAAVVADEPTVIYSLSRKQLAQLERSDPDAAAVFHRLIARLLADRTVHLMRTVEALQK
jgi:SulP family sulfate permease